ncbi:MAG: hypothetical protein QNJ63_28240 [Calothrix sp. MO_192.B10]|nr:hypothetical protein [Calothrix sp. MO_192.B10]
MKKFFWFCRYCRVGIALTGMALLKRQRNSPYKIAAVRSHSILA